MWGPDREDEPQTACLVLILAGFKCSLSGVGEWVTEAAEALAESTGDEDWLELSAHDLRRSWATTVYYRLDGSDVAKSVIMRWGGGRSNPRLRRITSAGNRTS